MGIKIIGAGKYLPEKVITNEDLSKIVDTSDEWITARTGIKKRQAATQDFTYQMAAKASVRAIANAGITAQDIDIVITSTCTGDYVTPSLACLVANELKIKNAACFEINCACAGFVCAVDMANRYLKDDEYHTALVVSSEMLTKITDYTDRSTCVLFGDGAGACVIQKDDGIFSSFISSDPTGGRHLFGRGIPPSNQFRDIPFDALSDGFAESKGHTLHQDGRDVYKFAIKAMPEAIRKACEKSGIAPKELSMILPHQANLRILETASKRIGLPMEKFYVNIQNHGNMSSACIPICIAEAMEEDILHHGDKICIVGFGGGLVYASAVFEW